MSYKTKPILQFSVRTEVLPYSTGFIRMQEEPSDAQPWEFVQTVGSSVAPESILTIGEPGDTFPNAVGGPDAPQPALASAKVYKNFAPQYLQFVAPIACRLISIGLVSSGICNSATVTKIRVGVVKAPKPVNGEDADTSSDYGTWTVIGVLDTSPAFSHGVTSTVKQNVVHLNSSLGDIAPGEILGFVVASYGGNCSLNDAVFTATLEGL